MKSQTETTRQDQGKVTTARFVHTDKIVRRLDEFPELTKALREGDLATVSILCAQLFELNSDTKVPSQTRRHHLVGIPGGRA